MQGAGPGAGGGWEERCMGGGHKGALFVRVSHSTPSKVRCTLFCICLHGAGWEGLCFLWESQPSSSCPFNLCLCVFDSFCLQRSCLSSRGGYPCPLSLAC